MKTQSFKFLTMLATVWFAGLMVTSCSDDNKDTTPPVDKTELNAAIAAAIILHDDAVEGKLAGEYQVGSKSALKSAIDLAQSVADDETATATEVANAITALANAVTTFEGKIIAEIDPANLIAYWKFDEGTGTTVTDDSGNSHDGTLTTGHSSLGSGFPTWVADRNGDSGKALHFTKGGHVLVPSNAAFTPAEISVSAWVRLDNVSADLCGSFLVDRCRDGAFMDSYIISQNDYNGYKFQTQDDRYPFFTTHITDTYVDRAATTAIDKEAWYQLAATFKNGEMKFYINGEDVTKAGADGEIPAGAFVTLENRMDFVIGQALPNAEVPSDISWTLGHFEGAIDDIRLYKTVLTPSQIQSIYDREKPNE